MKNDWNLIFVLPNLTLNQTFETAEIALVPQSDERVKHISNISKEAETLLNGFINNSGRKIEPSVLMLKLSAPEKVWTPEALTAFRNIVALSVIVNGWASIRKNGNTPFNPLFSDIFDFFPMTIGKKGGFIINTPALKSYGSSDIRFVATSSPHVSMLNFGLSLSVDKTIYEPLIKLWIFRFSKPGINSLTSRRLFRSLEIAYYALSVPNKNESTIYDYGVNIALWVSAFEILAHPGDKNVDLESVLQLLDNYNWLSESLRKKTFSINFRGKKICVNYCQKLYQYLYNARNDFFHGNNTNKKSLYPNGNANMPYLWVIAPVIYRVALVSYLIEYGSIKTAANSMGRNYEDDYFTQMTYDDFFIEILKESRQ